MNGSKQLPHTQRFQETLEDLITICEQHPFWSKEEICKAAGVGLNSFDNTFKAQSLDLKEAFGSSTDRNRRRMAEELADLFDTHPDWDLPYTCAAAGRTLDQVYRHLLPISERLRASYAQWKERAEKAKGLTFYETQLLKAGYSRKQIKRISNPYGLDVL